MIDYEQAEELDAERARHERTGATAHDLGVIAPAYIRLVSPVHGEPVVFVPGELLPRWAADALRSSQGHYEPGSGTFVLDEAPALSRADRLAS